MEFLFMQILRYCEKTSASISLYIIPVGYKRAGENMQYKAEFIICNGGLL